MAFFLKQTKGAGEVFIVTSNSGKKVERGSKSTIICAAERREKMRRDRQPSAEIVDLRLVKTMEKECGYYISYYVASCGKSEEVS